MQRRISSIIYVILQFIAFFFVLVGTPIDMFRDDTEGMYGNTPCITLWGFQFDCYSVSYDNRSDHFWGGCHGRRDRFRAAQAFAILSVVVYGTAFVLGLFAVCWCPFFRWVCLVLNIVGILTLCIVWASMVVTYYKDEGESCPQVGFFFAYGVGFALFLVAWCLDIINIFFLLLPCEDQKFGESGNPKPSTRHGEEEMK
uniref:Amastin-like surface protein n=1 Tax=Leishmania infantum TaxID=5671 RepID=Q9GU51_LEIIN|nr:amastin-like surface protein [Leishmania infantum]